MSEVKTYNPKEIIASFGSHMVSGYAEDSFITIDPNGDTVTKKVGVDGEIVRSISTDKTYIVKISLMQTSKTNTFLQEKLQQDRDTGDGVFPVLIKNLKGGLLFEAECAWSKGTPSRSFGKEAGTREWEIHTGEANLTE